MRLVKWMAVLVLVVSAAACVKPSLTAKEQTLKPFERTLSSDANQTYYAIRWALAATGYPVGNEDLRNGTISTAWIPTKAGSHYLDPFDRQEPPARDWANNSGYYKMEFQVSPEGATTHVVVTARVRSVIANLYSSGEQEELVLNKIGDYLRSGDPDVTNVGIATPK